MTQEFVKSQYESKRDATFRSLLLIYAAIFLCKSILPSNIETLKTTLSGTTDLAIGIDAAGYLLISTISILFFGYYSEKLSEKYSIKKIFVITQFGWVACFGLIALVPHFLYYLILDFIGAFFIGAFLPIAFAMIGDFYPPKERGVKFGWLSFGLIIGSGGGIIFGKLLGGLIPDIGWRLAYGLGFILGFLAVQGYFRIGIVPERGRAEPEFQDISGKIDYNYRLTFKSVKQLFKSKTIGALLISVLISGVGTAALGVWAINYFETVQLATLGASAGFIAMLFYVIAGLGALPGNILGGKLGDKYYREGKLKFRVLISIGGAVGGLFCMLGFYLIPFLSSTPLEVALSSVLILGLGFLGYLLASFPVGNQFAIYSEVCLPEARSSANAFHGVCVNLGGVFGNLLFASVIAGNESLYQFAVAIALLFWFGSIVFWIVPYFKYPKEAQKCREVLQIRRKQLDEINVQ